MKSLVAFVVAAVSLVTAAVVPDAHVVHETREGHSARWNKLGRVRSTAVLPMRIGLVQSNLDKSHEYLMDVSHPDSPNFGKHWTSQEVIDAFKPADDTIDTVRQWLVEHGIKNPTLSDNKAWFAFHATADQAESLLHTEYFEYEDSLTGGILPSCESYNVPKRVQPHIDYITPGVKLFAPHGELPGDGSLSKRSTYAKTRSRPMPESYMPLNPTSSNSTGLKNCDKIITPACIAALYEIPPGHLKSPNNSLGIFEAELQLWDQLDLDKFFANLTDGRIPNGTHPKNILVDGARAQTNFTNEAGEEALLDLDIAYPITYPQTVTVWSVDDVRYQMMPNNTYTWGFNSLLDAMDGSYCTYSAFGEKGDAPGIDPSYPDPGVLGYDGKLMCGVFSPPNVMSVSYGGQEVDLPIAYQKRQCNEFLKLGLQGVSFIYASGDAGVANYPEPRGDNGPTGCLGPKGNVFNPTWPNTCPYLTNVGATKILPNYTASAPETAVNDPAGHPYQYPYSSGGGFSNVYRIPDYQKEAIEEYFTHHDPGYPHYSGLASDARNPVKPNVTRLAGTTSGVYNRMGRGVPDVAAIGDNIAVYSSGKFKLTGGTSASAPVFAAIINRINEERIATGKGPLGFLNPTLYKNPEMFNDITSGSNPGCGTDGFKAVKGWDPVTGLGTPNYPRMLEVFMGLP
ncbi:putative protease S8 tripeptidyl peptidase I [Piedraia hortae CBS 480.64]|uniref:Putative protease S8 tripeptidyl peptidase I n=1 Tax=Piedraia hortae CBS 480.64 TaxID=1314780 RepID=A0A6A7BRF7_9PEZI|nr:putative protease S8 tripeptidyl peptidase I [Piedraia hortae CBS 480.64]